MKDPEQAVVFRDDKPRTWPLFGFDLDIGPDGPLGYVLWALLAGFVIAVTRILVGLLF